ncbi:MAG: hypothetical protein JWQ43_2562 [Glaciihabitans sp.]|nr:hypothetical protein [Glaciihabitans sp.]
MFHVKHPVALFAVSGFDCSRRKLNLPTMISGLRVLAVSSAGALTS